MNGMLILSALRLAISIGLSLPFFFFSQLFGKERKGKGKIKTYSRLFHV
jgi:hypothetical protein